jgi:hypothetical protein
LRHARQAKIGRSRGRDSVTDAEPPAFPGFSLWVFEWFEGLERDNSRDYFTTTRDRYER